jgi:hypothetical protein
MLEDLVSAEFFIIIFNGKYNVITSAHIKYSSKLKIIYINMLKDLVSAEFFVIIFNGKYNVITSAHIKYSSKLKIIYINMLKDLVSAEIFLLLTLLNNIILQIIKINK